MMLADQRQHPGRAVDQPFGGGCSGGELRPERVINPEVVQQIDIDGRPAGGSDAHGMGEGKEVGVL
jgi:hypothetical protein